MNDMLSYRYKKRVSQVFLFAVKNLSPSLIGFVISWLVIRYFSPGLWGSVVEHSLWVYVLGSAATWGSRDFLLRGMSEKPAEMTTLFSSSLLTRALLLPLWMLVLWMHTGNQSTLLLVCILWLLARYFYQSFDTLVFYEKRFGLLVLAEMAGGLIAVAAILMHPENTNSLYLITVLMLADWIKVLVLGISFKKIFRSVLKWKIRRVHLIGTLSFVGIGFTGLLVSRADQFIVNYYLPDGDKAMYQVYLNLLMLIIIVPGFLIAPNLKNLYRAADPVFKKVQSMLWKTALILVPIGILGIWLIMNYFFGFVVSPLHLLFGVLLVIPSYLYTLYTFLAYKNNHQSAILIINLAGLVLSFLLGNFLAPHFHTLGALAGAIAGQWLICGLILSAHFSGYFIKHRSTQRKFQEKTT
jgi:O-antigen/teichoic acid export membrane protein